MFNNGNEAICRNSRVYLYPNRIFGYSPKRFYAQMLLDPFEKQFDTPPAAVELRDGQSRFGEVVGEKHQCLAGLRVAKADAAQRLGIIAPGIEARQDNRLVETQARAFVHRARVTALETEVVFGPGDEKGRAGVQPVQARKVQIAAIHNVERARLVAEIVEDVHVVNLARRENDHGGKVAAQGQQGMQLDRGLVAAELGPREKRETQIDGGRVQGIGRLFEFDPKRFVGIDSSS